jgi:hypothetical protein
MLRLLAASVAALVVAVVTGCAPMENPDVVAFRQWAGATGAQVEAGQVAPSAYYAEGFSRLERSSDTSPHKYVLMRALSDMIPVARAYEAGQISAEQFEDAKRATRLYLAEQNQALENQRQQAIATAMRQASDNLRRQAPISTACSESFGVANCRTTR